MVWSTGRLCYCPDRDHSAPAYTYMNHVEGEEDTTFIGNKYTKCVTCYDTDNSVFIFILNDLMY